MTAPNALRSPRRTRARGRGTSAGGTLVGIFIGVVVGLGLAAGVAYWLMRNNPALPMPVLSGEKGVPSAASAASAAPAPDKPRFDFYKILPGVEDAKLPANASRAAGGASVATPPATAATTTGSAVAQKPGARSWLQAGSFTTDADAENLKARLALTGLEASVQTGALSDGSVRYRVRLGPYDNADELARMKSELVKRGFEVAVVRF